MGAKQHKTARETAQKDAERRRLAAAVASPTPRESTRIKAPELLRIERTKLGKALAFVAGTIWANSNLGKGADFGRRRGQSWSRRRRRPKRQASQKTSQRLRPRQSL
jgi:hypothetical protein